MKLRFTIRDLMWLAVVITLAVGWWINRAHYNGKIDQLNFERNILVEQQAMLTAEIRKRIVEQNRDASSFAIKDSSGDQMSVVPSLYDRGK